MFDRFRTGKEIQELLGSGDYSEDDAIALRRFRYLDLKELADILQSFADSEIHAKYPPILPAEEEIGVVPAFGNVHVEAVQPALLAFGHRLRHVLQQPRATGDAHVR